MEEFKTGTCIMQKKTMAEEGGWFVGKKGCAAVKNEKGKWEIGIKTV